MASRRIRSLLALSLVLFVVAVVALLQPIPRRGLEADAHPAADYAEAIRRVQSLRAEDGPAIATDCGTRLLTHGARTSRVIVLLHGLTNCPAQFDSLGRMSFARGANVLIPRLPRHGFTDKMCDELAHIDAGELRAFTDRVLDAAHGLGDSVTVCGLSVGGTLAAWAAEERHDVDRVVMIAPVLGVMYARGPWTPALARLAGTLPNVFVWWDGKRKQNLPGPKHVYPRFSSRSIAATLELGAVACQDAKRSAPGARSLAMVTVGGDPAVDNATCAAIVKAWSRHGTPVETFEFPGDLQLNHDIVDPEQVGGNPTVTYPVLTRLIGP